MQTENVGDESKAGKLDQKSLGEIEKAAKEAQDTRKKFRLVSWILTLAIVAVFVIFGLLCYSTVKGNFTEDKLLKSMKQHIKDISPEVSEHAASLITDVGPVYGKMGRERLKKVMPKWVELGKKELSRIGNSLGEVAEEEMHGAVTAAIEKSGLKEVLPELTDEQIERLRRNLEARIVQDIEDISQHLIDRTSGEIIEISNTLDTFDLSGLPDNEDGLNRLIAHDLLMLLDKQIMEPSEEDFVNRLAIHDLLKNLNELAEED